MAASAAAAAADTDKSRKPALSFFGSSKLFTSFISRSSFEADSKSPTSTLDPRPFFRNPFRSDPNARPPAAAESTPKRPWEVQHSRRPVGLGIIDQKPDSKNPSSENRVVLLGSQLKIQIPPLPPPPYAAASPNSPAESPVRVFAGCLSEDYTCVIAHGPNPRTTHIFEDCVVGRYSGAVGLSKRFEIGGGFGEEGGFLSVCYACNKSLGHGKDIFMYRGEKAFCSRECRYQEMLMEEGGAQDLDSDAL